MTESWDEAQAPIPPTQSAPAPGTPRIMPQPLPEHWQLAPGVNGGIVVRIDTLNGVHVSFLSPEFALELAENLRSLCGKPNIVVAPAGALGQLRAQEPRGDRE